MFLTLQFTNNGIPVVDLTPSISGYRLDNNTLVFNGIMNHVAQGIYKYDFSTYDDSLDYSFIADGGSTLSNIDRYQYGSNDLAQITTQADSISAAHASELAIIAGLVQRNQRITNCTYGSNGELLTSVISIYPTANDAENETNAIKQFSLEAIYSGTTMIDYLVKEL